MPFYLIVSLLITMHCLHTSGADVSKRGSTSMNLTCITIPFATLSSRNDDRFSQLRLFSSMPFYSNLTNTCGKFDTRPSNTIYARPLSVVIGSFCTILQANPMLLIYLNEYMDEHHASPAAYLFFLKIFTVLEYPILSFNFFHPFHPSSFPSLRFFQLAPTYREEARALMLLLERYDWNAFSLVIDPRLPGEIEIMEEFEAHSGESRHGGRASFDKNYRKSKKKFTILSAVYVKNNNPAHIRQQLLTMNPETRVIIVHTTSTLASLIVKQASNMSLTGAEYMWIMSSIVLSTYSGGNDPKMNPYDNPNRRKMNFPSGTLALYHDSTRESFLSHFDKYIGPLLINVFSKLTHLDIMQQLYTNVTAPRYISLRSRSICDRIFATNVSLHQASLKHPLPELYNLLKDEFKRAIGIFQHDGLAMASNYSILNFQTPNNEWKKVGDYINQTLTIADIQWPGERSKPPPGKPIIHYLKAVTLAEYPFVMLKDPSPEGTCQVGSIICRIGPENSGANHSDSQHFQCCSGFYIDIFNILKDRLKFEFELYQVLDRTWGGRDPTTNKWNGLVADILDNKADLTLTSLKITSERNEAIDFSIPLMETGIGLIVSLRPGAISTTAFLKPYDYRIWVLMIIFTLHGVAIMIYLFEFFKKRMTEQHLLQKKDHKQGHDKSLLQIATDFMRSSKRQGAAIAFSQSVWLTWVILFRAPAKVVHPKCFTSKFLANIWACFCLAFTASYTANLAAFMITKEEYYDLSGINDLRLANPHSMKPSFRYGTVANGVISISTEEVVKKNHREIYSYLKQFMKKNISEGIKALKAGDLHAFLYDAVVLDYLSGQDDGCKLRVVGNWYAMTGYGIGFPKQSKFKEMIDKEIIQMHETGEIERLRRFWFTGACKTSMAQQSQRSSQPLGSLNFISAFLLLFGGTIIASIIFICENCYSRITNRSRYRDTESHSSKEISMSGSWTNLNNPHMRPTPREKLLEKRVERLQKRIYELERQSISERRSQRNSNRSEEMNQLLFETSPIAYHRTAENLSQSNTTIYLQPTTPLKRRTATPMFETVV